MQAPSDILRRREAKASGKNLQVQTSGHFGGNGNSKSKRSPNEHLGRGYEL